MRAMSDEHLGLTLKETIKNLFHLRFQSATERLETPSEIRKAKKDVARIKTVQREHALLNELLAQLPSEEAGRIRDMREPGHRLAAAQAALKKTAKGRKRHG
jgi:large subunit ribosomal protein L29